MNFTNVNFTNVKFYTLIAKIIAHESCDKVIINFDNKFNSIYILIIEILIF